MTSSGRGFPINLKGLLVRSRAGGASPLLPSCGLNYPSAQWEDGVEGARGRLFLLMSPVTSSFGKEGPSRVEGQGPQIIRGEILGSPESLQCPAEPLTSGAAWSRARPACWRLEMKSAPGTGCRDGGEGGLSPARRWDELESK